MHLVNYFFLLVEEIIFNNMKLNVSSSKQWCSQKSGTGTGTGQVVITNILTCCL